jgi:limonene-1,2-epoxide hydrolase
MSNTTDGYEAALAELIIKQTCIEVVTRYAEAVNDWDIDAFVGLFGEDAIWQRPGQPPLRGHSEIRGFMEAQPVDRVLRHVNGGVRVEVLGAERTRVWSQTTVYDTLGTTQIPAPLAGPDMIVEYRDEHVLFNGDWRIARRDTTVVFRREQ